MRSFLVLLTLALLIRSDYRFAVDSAPVDNGECTTAVIAGSATASGRPLLWKNRDVSQPDQEIVYFTDGLYPYVTIANAGDSSQAWGGVNATGFAVEDANNWNTTDSVQGPDDDGRIIKLALRTCQTVNDFQAILDSTSVVGHTQPAIFGVIDGQGGASMFETFVHSYIRYDASNPNHAPLGVLVRSNFSYAGAAGGRIGVYRHDRAKALIEQAVQGDSLTAKYICRRVARDLRVDATFDPYPLPYEGQQGGLPRGWISTYGATCRRLTVSACIIEGVMSGENPLLATLWAFPMAVQYGVALPFWVAGGQTPAVVNGDSTGALCDIGLRIKHLAQHAEGFHDTLDTYILENGVGGGIHATTYPLEDSIFVRTERQFSVWRQNGQPGNAAALTAQMAQLAYDSLVSWPGPGDLIAPPKAVRNLTAYWVRQPDLVVRLRWSAVTQDTLGAPITPIGYSIWHSDDVSQTFDSVGFATGTTYIIAAPANGVNFYRIKALSQ